jgi:hypothetical protein
VVGPKILDKLTRQLTADNAYQYAAKTHDQERNNMHHQASQKIPNICCERIVTVYTNIVCSGRTLG